MIKQSVAPAQSKKVQPQQIVEYAESQPVIVESQPVVKSSYTTAEYEATPTGLQPVEQQKRSFTVNKKTAMPVKTNEKKSDSKTPLIIGGVAVAIIAMLAMRK